MPTCLTYWMSVHEWKVGQPIKLLPQTTPDYGEVSPPPEGTDPGQPTAPQGFEIAPLEAVGTDYAGTLEPGDGGLGIDMWRGTDRGDRRQGLGVQRGRMRKAPKWAWSGRRHRREGRQYRCWGHVRQAWR